jgi:hypothetical protein
MSEGVGYHDPIILKTPCKERKIRQNGGFFFLYSS